MKQIIKTVVQALNEVDAQEEAQLLKKLEPLMLRENLTAIASLPISIVSKRSRIKHHEVKKAIKECDLYNQDDNAYDHYTVKQLAPSVWLYPSLFQSIDMALFGRDSVQEVLFASKRPNDYWKRMTNCDTLQAMIKVETFAPATCQISFIDKELKESSNGQWSLESRLRDDMRSKKENPLLRGKPYLVVYIVQEGEGGCDAVQAMLAHYFNDKVVEEETRSHYFIGYALTLDEVSLRTFYKKQ